MPRWILPALLAAVTASGCGDTTPTGPITKEVEEKVLAEQKAAEDAESSMPRADGSPAAKGKKR